MAANPGVVNVDDSVGSDECDCAPESLTRAYTETYRGPHDAPVAQASAMAESIRLRPEQLVSPVLLAAHRRLGRCRKVGDTNIAAYAEDDPSGFGPALQLAADEAPMLLESLTVLLARLGLAYVGIMSPVFRVQRAANGELVGICGGDGDGLGHAGIDEAWIHVQLAPGVDAEKLVEAERLLPSVLADAHQVAQDTEAMKAALLRLAEALDGDASGLSPNVDRCEVANLLRWLVDGHFVPMGYQRCTVRDGHAHLEEESRLGVLRSRRDVFPATDRLRRRAHAGAGDEPELPALRHVSICCGGS